MTRLWFASLTAFASCALFLPARPAAADCPPGSRLCVDVEARGSLRVGGSGPRRAQVITVEEQPPPPPRVVVVEAEPRHEEPPPPPPPEPAPPPPRPRREPRFGIHGHVGGIGARNVQMGGAGAAFRFRPSGRLALDLGAGLYAGTDYNGLDRTEVPLTADLLLYVNPQNALQVYFVGGLGLAAAHAEGVNIHTDEFESRDFGYVGAQLGAGLEWRLGRHFALNADLRGFVRQRVDDNDNQPEFIEYDHGRPTGRTTDTSAGVLGTFGGTVYF
ncbi:MAG: outer membrane beta-barrel protein [Myxococcota bacterium]